MLLKISYLDLVSVPRSPSKFKFIIRKIQLFCSSLIYDFCGFFYVHNCYLQKIQSYIESYFTNGSNIYILVLVTDFFYWERERSSFYSSYFLDKIASIFIASFVFSSNTYRICCISGLSDGSRFKQYDIIRFNFLE